MSHSRRPRVGPASASVLGSILLIALSGCRAPALPDVTIPPVVIRIEPDRQWTDTGVRVRKDELLYVSASGEVFWDARHRSAGPDGINGSPGWVFSGGLIARVSSMPKVMDIGARTQGVRVNPRSPKTSPLPPIRMPADGTLLLGFKDFTPGSNTGGFEITVRRTR